MHVIYIHQYFCTPKDAGGTRSYEFSKRLIAAGHRVSMICGISDLNECPGRKGDVLRYDEDGIDVHKIVEPYSNAMGFARRWLAFLRFAAKAYEAARTIKDVDLVFATSTPLTVGDPGRKAAKFHRCPFVFEVRDLWPELPIAMGLVKNGLLKWYLKRMELRAYRAASRCIALAPGIKDGIAETGFPHEKIAMIPNACDTKLFVPEDTQSEVNNDPRFGSPGDFRLVFSGAHGLANGLDAVVDAAAELKKRNVHGIRLCLIGTGGMKSKLMQRSKNEGLDGYISWVDPLKKPELAKILPQMDVGMQILKNVPAFYRGTSPNKFFDYLAGGIPILNNYPGWLAETIKENNCGVVVPPDHPAAFADAIVDLMQRRNEPKELGRNARRLAETVFSRDQLGQMFVETIEKTSNEWKTQHGQ